MTELDKLLLERVELSKQYWEIGNQIAALDRQIAILQPKTTQWYVHGILELHGVAFGSREELTQLVESKIEFAKKYEDSEKTYYFPTDRLGEECHVRITSRRY